MQKKHAKLYTLVSVIFFVIGAAFFIRIHNSNIVSNQPMLNSIRTQVSFGPRVVGSLGHQRTKDYIIENLYSTENKVIEQKWVDNDTGFSLTNIVARFNPAASERIIIATHYDTDPKANKDKFDKNQKVPGASDGASGTAVLLEIAKNLNHLGIPASFGVDLVFFDAENFEAGRFDDWNPKGSSHFSKNINEIYSQNPSKALVIDMVCDNKLNFKRESSSIAANPNDLEMLWGIGKEINTEAFTDLISDEIKDDHTPLNAVGIPSILLIDLDYPYHDSSEDTVDKCSEKSLQTTFQAVGEYLIASSRHHL